MHADAALSETIRSNNLMDSRLRGEANILVCPNLDAANILFNTIKVLNRDGSTIGPILMGGGEACSCSDAVLDGAAHPVHDGAGRGADLAPHSRPLIGLRRWMILTPQLSVVQPLDRIYRRIENQLVESQIQPAAELESGLADRSGMAEAQTLV